MGSFFSSSNNNNEVENEINEQNLIRNNIKFNQKIFLQKKDTNLYLSINNKSIMTNESKTSFFLRKSINHTYEGNISNNDPIILASSKQNNITKNCGWYGCRVLYFDEKSNLLKADHGKNLIDSVLFFEKQNDNHTFDILHGDTIYIKNKNNKYLNELCQFEESFSGNEWIIWNESDYIESFHTCALYQIYNKPLFL